MAVALGRGHTALVTEDGAGVWTLGTDGRGLLGAEDEEAGTGTGTGAHRPTRLGAAPFRGARVVMLACGAQHTAAVASDGALLLWGHNYFGQLGLGDTRKRRTPFRLGPEAFGGAAVAAAAAGCDHTLALSVDGAVWSCGEARHGQLGHAADVQAAPPHAEAGVHDFDEEDQEDLEDQHFFRRLHPAHFGGLEIVWVAAGEAHSAAVSADGVVWTWGHNWCGQVGTGDRNDRRTPKRLDAAHFEGARALLVACGGGHTAAVTEVRQAH